MRWELMIVAFLLWGLLAVAHLSLPAAQAQGLTLTLRMDQASYPMGSQATFTLILRSATPVTGETNFDALGCDWDIVILDATGTEVFHGSRVPPSEDLYWRFWLPWPPAAQESPTLNREAGHHPAPQQREW